MTLGIWRVFNRWKQRLSIYKRFSQRNQACMWDFGFDSISRWCSKYSIFRSLTSSYYNWRAWSWCQPEEKKYLLHFHIWIVVSYIFKFLAQKSSSEFFLGFQIFQKLNKPTHIAMPQKILLLLVFPLMSSPFLRRRIF